MSKPLLTLPVALLAAAALAWPAGAVDDTMPVVGCAGLAFKDKVNDQVSGDPSGTGLLEGEGQANEDIIAGWMNTTAKETTANIQLRDLTTAAPPTSTAGIWYYVMFEVGDATHFVRTAVDGGSAEYAFGTYDPSTGVYTTDGDTTGKLFEGKEGVVQMVVPADIAKPGAKLVGVRADADEIFGTDDVTGLNMHSDEAPDDDAPGKAYAVQVCEATPGGTPAPGQTPAPGSTPTVSPTPAPGGGGPGHQAALPLRTPVFIGSARKAKKGKTVRLRVESTEPITGLKVSIKASSGKGAAFAKGSLKSLDGRGTLKLKVKRSFKKGRYLFSASGTVDGQKRTLNKQVGVKK